MVTINLVEAMYNTVCQGAGTMSNRDDDLQT